MIRITENVTLSTNITERRFSLYFEREIKARTQIIAMMPLARQKNAISAV
jgi:hypothetical protein